MPRKISAGVILVDARGRVLMQLRDDNPAIMFPGHWGLTGGAGNPGETPEAAARREIVEETGLTLGEIEPFRAYYFQETPASSGARKAASRRRADYEVYVFHAPCATPVEEMICGEGRELRFFAPDEFPALDVAYNHRDVLSDFFASAAYGRYVRGDAFGESDEPDAIDPIEQFLAELDAGDPWFDAMMQAIARWQLPAEVVEDRNYRYLVGGEAFDWLLLAERLIAAAGTRIPEAEAERLLFAGDAPGADPAAPASAGRVPDELLREAFGESKHRAHLNYLYGVTVEEALQYAVELEVAKERSSARIDDRRTDEHAADPVYQRIYGESRGALLRQFREEMRLPHAAAIVLSELREFMYWLFKYRVSNQEPARVASDTRKALAQLSAMEAAVRRARSQPRAGEPSPVEAFEPAG
jgi:8-oxo-dGTP pyrophosphatase MutT (NUDIX family)